ncbi:hypothetical protein Ahy_B01g053961 [Arachis hypogaea]|uniref:Aminotransferase-like plant mobile domain-containing protein n=1 Tax=Arachis hypogaea TaxID=3818 RepID=A0A445ASZ9_ARAHY|nr:hypothetical protein Ahy_B01g053961 [Arachis hypogaea]
MDFPTDTNENTLKIYALTYIMTHLSTQLFINKLGTRVHIRWLPYVTNLDKLGKYSWSFAMLAWLYCNTVACVTSFDTTPFIDFLVFSDIKTLHRRCHYMIASSLNFNLLGCTILPGFISSDLSSMRSLLEHLQSGVVQRSTLFICHLGNVRSHCRILCPKGSLHRFDLGVILSFGELPLEKEILDSPTDTNENTVKIYALAYIMMHLSTQLFINKLGNRVHIRWLPYVTNLDKLRKYSWSFTMLAWLYCNTVACVASLT